MAKGPVIPDDVKRDIAEVYLEHRDWRAKEIQSEVNSRLRKRNYKINPDWPGLSAVQKQLTQIRKNIINQSLCMHIHIRNIGLLAVNRMSAYCYF